MDMSILAKAFFDIPEAASLPLPGDGGGFPALITGLSGVHRAQLAAALGLRTGRSVLLLTPDEAAAEALAGDLAAFTGERSTLLTGREFVFISADAVSRQTEQRRLGALRELLGGARYTIITAQGLFQRAMPPEDFRRAAFDIDLKSRLEPGDAEDALLRCGYSRAAQVEGPGQFSRRGGILDFFSPSQAQPLRVEFWGDEIDSISSFDTASQRRTESLERCSVLPAAETLPSLCRGGSAQLAAELKKLAARAERRGDARLAGTLAEDAERLENGAELRAADRYAGLICSRRACALDYAPEGALVVLDQPGRFMDRAREYAKQLESDVEQLRSAGRMASKAADFCLGEQEALDALARFPLYMADAFTSGRYPLPTASVTGIAAKQLPSYAGSARQAADDARQYLENGSGVLLLAGDMRRANILAEMLRKEGVRAAASENPGRLPGPGQCLISSGGLSAGLEYPSLRLAVLTDTQIMGAGLRRQKRRKKAVGEKIDSCADLAVGDLVVHEQHGIGRFAGVVRIPVDGAEKDYMKICYAGTDSLYVPATQLDLVTKYVGAGEDSPVRLSKLGGAEWQRTKSRAKAAAKELARGLIALYAERSRLEGFAFPPDSPWQTEFEERFGFEETEDQLRCIEEIKADMEKPQPMDRLLCGDGAYG